MGPHLVIRWSAFAKIVPVVMVLDSDFLKLESQRVLVGVSEQTRFQVFLLEVLYGLQEFVFVDATSDGLHPGHHSVHCLLIHISANQLLLEQKTKFCFYKIELFLRWTKL